jgi:hypothetical protein
MRSLIEDMVTTKGIIEARGLELVHLWESMERKKREEWISRLEPFCSDRVCLSRASWLLLQLESKETWTQEQFRHVKQFPLVVCECGTSLCFSCGARPFHEGRTCMEHMRLCAEYPTEESLSLQWKLAHTKQCPQCSTMITRSEGCNKVECLVCSYEFCWNCLGEFRVCGYYKCQLGPVLKVESKTEMGVPDVDVVYRRFGFAN